MKPKTRVFLTGATGVMGYQGMKEILRYPESYELTILARDSKKNKKKLSPFLSPDNNKSSINVIWGDLSDRKTLEKGIRDADIVLHVGGMVSPEADFYPEKTLQINIESIRLISEIVKKIEEKQNERTIKTVYIGSVSQYGPSMPPNHFKGVGSKMRAAQSDAYAVSKIVAEHILATSGLKKWVSLRQTAILHAGLLKKADNPVMFHVPFEGVLEWVSDEDSGRLLERVCRADLPDSFWCNFYNVGGGEKWRLTNLEFEKRFLKTLGLASPDKIFEPNWFASDNFHGVWFNDSDKLEDILHYRSGDSFDDYMQKIKKNLPFYYRMAPLVPSPLIKRFMKYVASKPPLGPLYWIKSVDTKRIGIAWGSISKYKSIQNWDKYEFNNPKRDFNSAINNNYDSLDKNLKEKHCPRGHKYLSSEWLEICGGHTCPECLKEEFNNIKF